MPPTFFLLFYLKLLVKLLAFVILPRFFFTGNQSMGNNASKEPVFDEDFPSLQEAAMLAKGVKIDEQRKRNSTPQQSGNVHRFRYR